MHLDRSEGWEFQASVDAVLGTKAVMYPKSACVIAIPYYEQTEGENEWSGVCGACPDLGYAQNYCNANGTGTGGPNIVGKKSNFDIARMVKRAGLGGVFPWVLDYDVAPTDNVTCGNNSLFPYLKKGLRAAA